MAKPKKVKVDNPPLETPKGLDIKVKLEHSLNGRLTVKVTLLQDGVEVASDYDFVQL